MTANSAFAAWAPVSIPAHSVGYSDLRGQIKWIVPDYPIREFYDRVFRHGQAAFVADLAQPSSIRRALQGGGRVWNRYQLILELHTVVEEGRIALSFNSAHERDAWIRRLQESSEVQALILPHGKYRMRLQPAHWKGVHHVQRKRFYWIHGRDLELRPVDRCGGAFE